MNSIEYLDLGAVAPAATAAPAEEQWVRVLDKEPAGSPTTLQDGWIERRPGSTTGTRLLKPEMRDGAVRAEFRTASGQWSGDLWLRKGDRERYAASRDDHAVRLTYHSGDSPVTLQEFPVPALAVGETYALELRAVGRTLTVKLDGNEVIRVEVDRITAGRAAIYVSEKGAVSAVEFLNLDQPNTAPAK